MTLQNHPETQPLKAHGTVPGSWSLMPGTALSLLPREAGALRMASGRVWATVDGPHIGCGNESGDHFLVAGQTLAVRSGQRLVLESWNPVPGLPAYFDWTPLVADRTVPTTNWQVAVVQPARDLRHAVLAAGRALGQLVLGLAASAAPMSGLGLRFGLRVFHQAPQQPGA